MNTENQAHAPNRIDAHLEFSFKGESYELSSTLDMDRVLEKYITLPSLHVVLAVEHGIDTCSCLYEAMREEDFRFDNAQGWPRPSFAKTALSTWKATPPSGARANWSTRCRPSRCVKWASRTSSSIRGSKPH